MPKTMPIEPEWLRATVTSDTVGVDRATEVITGYIVAQEGPFKSEDRGEFDVAALKSIVKLIKASPSGLKSRFTHPDMSNDGLGKFLGRVKNPRLDKISVRESQGQGLSDEITVVRSDLHIDPSSHNTPSGDLGAYVMDLAESDPDAMSSSLVLTVDQEYRIDKKGRPKKDDDGNELPPLWRPVRLHASDVVDTGDAVDGLLSVTLTTDGLPDAAVRQGAAMLDKVFADQTREVVEARLNAWIGRYLTRRYGGTPTSIVSVASIDDHGNVETETFGYDPSRDAEKEMIRRRNA